jgi:hypothetical protein
MLGKGYQFFYETTWRETKAFRQINLQIKNYSSISDNLAMCMKLLSKPELIFLEPNGNESGQLHFVEEPTKIPFPIKRLFWLNKIAPGAKRGIHAHREESQVLVCLTGKVSALLEVLSGEKFLFELNSPSKALLIPPMVWTEFTFDKDSVLLGISDRQYSEGDYIRERAEFEVFQKKFRSKSETFPV